MANAIKNGEVENLIQVINTNHLCEEELKKDLNWIFDEPSRNRNTCTNESFNLVVASKAPKMHHYSKS